MLQSNWLLRPAGVPLVLLIVLLFGRGNESLASVFLLALNSPYCVFLPSPQIVYFTKFEMLFVFDYFGGANAAIMLYC